VGASSTGSVLLRLPIDTPERNKKKGKTKVYEVIQIAT
jgi:hypothetical protein